MVRLKASRSILIALLGLIIGCFHTGSVFAAQLWSNRTGSLVRSSDGNANWISYDYWNNLLSQAAADGAGGVANEVMVPMTMTKASTAAELSAAAAFLPEAAVYAVVGATLGSLIWDSVNQSYEIPATGNPNLYVCPDGSSPTMGGDVGALTLAQWVASSMYNTYNHSGVVTNLSMSSGGGVTISYTIDGVNGIQPERGTGGPFLCPGLNSPGSQAPAPGNDVPPAQLVPYILPWLQSNPNSASQLASKEASSGDYPQASPPLLSGPSSVSLPPVTTTTTNPDGSTTKVTKNTTEIITYSGPNASASPTTTTTTTTTPAPTASNPSPSPTTTTSTTTSPVAPPSSAPASAPSPFTPPDASVPTVPPVPPGVIQLPLPNIDTTAGQCPAPIVMQLGLPGLQTATLDLTPWCNLAGELKPLVLTAGALAAMFILVK